MSDAPELKPCPFCGGEAEWKIGGPGCAFVSCKACPAETGDGSVPRILKAWNTRALTPSAPAPVVPKVKPLLWVYHPAGMVASNDMGGSYIIDTRGPRPKWLKWPGGHGPDLETVMGMQVAAQADHEARILPQLDMATVTVTEEG